MENVHILLVEDNRGDVRLVERVFEDRELPGTLRAVKTGDEALDWLHQRDDFSGAPRPDLLLLDLNLPGTSGQAVLSEIKSDPYLKRIPVIVLTSSKSEDDLIKAYEAGANACLIKPVGPDEFADLFRVFTDFWVSTAALPPISDHADHEKG